MATLDQLTDPAYLAQLRSQAEAQLAPSRDLSLNALTLNEQEIANQEAEARRQNELSNLGLNQQSTDITRQADTLAKTLQEQAVRSGQSLTERFNQLGLLQSGMTAAGLGDVQKTLAKGITESEADKATRLANIALQRAGLTNTLNSSLSNYGLQKQAVGLKRQQTQADFGSSINDLVDKLVEGQRAAEVARINAQKSSAATSNPFAGLLSNNQATSAPLTAAKPLSQFISDLFAQGQYITGTEAFAEDLSTADTIGGQVNPYKGMTKDQILAVAYPLRAKYETSNPQILANFPGTKLNYQSSSTGLSGGLPAGIRFGG